MVSVTSAGMAWPCMGPNTATELANTSLATFPDWRRPSSRARVLAVLECTAQSDALLPLYIRQGLALRALRPLNSLAPCFVLAAGCAARDPVPVWVPLQDRARLARLLASGYAALDSRQTAGQETLLAMYPA